MKSELLAPIDGRTQENLGVENGDMGVASSTNDHVEAHEPVKKPTRQWAAWTRQEEESFFCALRQVGKNFEKITCRVQSKNKDQVRHYYYRLVRRMNKLLGPELCLDAKNSKDTNAAMLRWWSLLEKYSCNVSKLHLKPRRYKIFVEALENQLLKYRKKNDRKKPQGGNCSPSPSTMSNHKRTCVHDSRQVRLVFVDSQNTQKIAPAKPSSKHASNVGKNHANAKADLTSVKPPRRRQKLAVGSTAAYKKWEKAAIAGVSLVADAAEHLESSVAMKDVENEPPQKEAMEVPSSVQVILPTPLVESSLQASMKLKLQLFPLDNITRRALEVENHNPHLELTLGSRKKISSIVEHLNRKWGSSSVASGELMLFPYNAQSENILICQRWTQRSTVSAAHVYTIVGSPEVFRLRYGWVSEGQSLSGTLQTYIQSCCRPKEAPMPVDGTDERTTKLHYSHIQNDTLMDPLCIQSCCRPKEAPMPVDCTDERTTKLHYSHIQNDTLMDPHAVSQPGCSNSAYPATGLRKRRATSPLNDNLVESTENAINSSFCAVDGSEEVLRQPVNEDELRLRDNLPPSAGEWADSLTDISIGGLLDVSICNDITGNRIQVPIAESPQCLPASSFTCDSFDAAIAAHISRYQSKLPYESTSLSHESSIWDAEETCDAFSFQRNVPVHKDRTTPSGTSSDNAEQRSSVDPVGTKTTKTKSCQLQEVMGNLPCGDQPVDTCMLDNQNILDNPAQEALGLTDVYWPDTLGPLDLDIPSSKYHSEHFILSDSLSSLNRLMANSLDSFPSCSIFGIENKEPGSSVEA